MNRHVTIEGFLYFVAALLGAVLTYISTEEAYKYISPVILFWMKLGCGSALTAFNALKAFRSMTFGRAYGQPTPPVAAQPTTQP